MLPSLLLVCSVTRYISCPRVLHAARPRHPHEGPQGWSSHQMGGAGHRQPTGLWYRPHGGLHLLRRAHVTKQRGFNPRTTRSDRCSAVSSVAFHRLMLCSFAPRFPHPTASDYSPLFESPPRAWAGGSITTFRSLTRSKAMITSAEMRSKRVQRPRRGSEKDRLSGAARVVGGLWEFGASSVLALCHRHYSPPRRLPTVDNGKFENVAQRA